MHRKSAHVVAQRRSKAMLQPVRPGHAMEFFNVLSGSETLLITEAYLPEHRERLSPATAKLRMFLRQALETDASCQQAVIRAAARRLGAERAHRRILLISLAETSTSLRRSGCQRVFAAGLRGAGFGHSSPSRNS